MKKTSYDPATTDRTSLYKIVAGVVVPRPIGLISTRGADGRNNVSPFSFFNALSDKPPYVCVSISRFNAEGRRKDTLQNIIDTREFVANIVSEDIAAAQDVCAREWPQETDEFEVSGLTPSKSRVVGAPGVEQSKANLECVVQEIVTLPESSYTLVVGKVVYIHVEDGLIVDNGRVDMARLAAVGRMVGNAYCKTSDRFTLSRDTFARAFVDANAKKPG